MNRLQQENDNLRNQLRKEKKHALLNHINWRSRFETASTQLKQDVVKGVIVIMLMVGLYPYSLFFYFRLKNNLW